MNCSALPKLNKYAYVVCCFVCFAPHCFATTVIILVTPEGIFVGADSKVSSSIIGRGSNIPAPAQTKKVFETRNGFIAAVVAVVNVGGLDVFDYSSNQSIYRYSDADVFERIDASISDQTTVWQLIDRIQTANLIALGRLPNVLHPSLNEQRNPVTAWIVAGYEGGVPIVSAVSFYADWEAAKMEVPIVTPWHPDPEFGLYRGFYYPVNGAVSAVSEVDHARYGVKNTEGYRYCIINALLECSKFLSGSTLTTKEAISFIHTLLRAQFAQTPQLMGPPFFITLLKPTGGIVDSVFPD